MRPSDLISFAWRRRVPLLFQTEAAECGIACLAMIASFHGHGVDVATLRRRFSVSMHGTTLAALIDFAHRLELETRAVRLDVSDLRRLRLPCVLHWQFVHFVVLTHVGRRGITIHDPSGGRRSVGLAEVTQAFTGVALELWPTPRFEPQRAKPPVSVRKLVGPISGLARSLALVAALTATLETFSIVSPLLLQWVVDHALLTASTDLLALLALGFGLLVLLEQATGAIRALTIMRFETTLNVQWHANVFSHLQRLPLPYFEKRHLGDIVSRFRSIDAIQRTITTAFVEALVDGAMTVALLAVMVVYSPALSSICCAAVAVYVVTRALTHGPLRGARYEQIAAGAKQDSHFIESVRGLRAIKSFRRSEERRSAWLSLLIEQVNAGLRAERLQLLLRSASGLTFGLENVLVIYLGAGLVLEADLTTGMLLAFLAYKRQFTSRVSTLVDKAFEMRLLRLHAERLADVVLTPPEEHPLPGRLLGPSGGSLAPTLEIRALRFRYAEHEPYVLDGLDLSVAAGESVAIVGASGCGKSTLLNIVLGTLAPTGGEVLIGGIPLAQIDHDLLRRTMASVVQNDCLFAGTIGENISFFDTHADRARIEECAQLAAIHTEIAALPMAYNTLVGFMGSTLSAGQQQRILLARALYARPSILVLDEATSHLDIHREAAVCAAMRKLAITRIVVAHRPQTAATADRIVALKLGKIVQVASRPG
jgi:ATP-binding cassette subfamily B protein RaxB